MEHFPNPRFSAPSSYNNHKACACPTSVTWFSLPLAKPREATNIPTFPRRRSNFRSREGVRSEFTLQTFTSPTSDYQASRLVGGGRGRDPVRDRILEKKRQGDAGLVEAAARATGGQKDDRACGKLRPGGVGSSLDLGRTASDLLLTSWRGSGDKRA